MGLPRYIPIYLLMVLAGRMASSFKSWCLEPANIKQSKIYYISSRHKKANCFQKGGGVKFLIQF
jgi:hypothetical protein